MNKLLNISVLSLFMVFSACGTMAGMNPRHAEYKPPMSNYQRMLAPCVGRDIKPCQHNYERIYGASSGLDYMVAPEENEHRLLEFRDIMAACEGKDPTPCQNKYDNMTVF